MAPKKTLIAALVLLGTGTGAGAQSTDMAQLNLAGLADLSLEQLGNIRVTSVSRRSESLQDAPASIFVISSEDIRRSGATDLPEALRLAPNLQVARTSAGQYAISARGFNNAIGNKLLVLVDGRTVYSPLFSGVFWDMQEVMLEDIERIEVISGPGATLWGANAVNGVINVITRPAGETQGGLVALGAGQQGGRASARFGGTMGDDGHYRVYATSIHRNHTEMASGAAVPDATSRKQIGFRADWGPADNGFTVQGDTYRGGKLPGTPEAPEVEGTNLLARWSRKADDGGSVRVQAYYEHTRRDEPVTFRDEMDILDVEFQHALAPTDTHRLMWGAGHRQARDSTQRALLVTFLPNDKQLRWTNIFLQDEIRLGERTTLTLGAKAESNVYTGWEFLPSVRLGWKPAEHQFAWAALSRAVRAPARLDREFFLPGLPPYFINGGPNFQSEVANVVEVGWRAQPTSELSYSITAFRHSYDKLRSGQPPPAVVENKMEGTTHGVEAWASWHATPGWRLTGGFVELRENLRLKPGSTDPTGPSALGNDPKHQWTLRSSHNLGARHELDLMLRRVGALPLPAVPAYTALDVRLGWRVNPDVDLSLTLKNLLDRRHVEFGASAGASQVERGAFVQVTWRM